MGRVIARPDPTVEKEPKLSKAFRPAQPSLLMRALVFVASGLMLRLPSVRRKVATLGDVADYLGWVSDTFGNRRLMRSRPALWEKIATEIKDGHWTVYEFGVAWGYTTNWWLSKDLPAIARWHGFDRFTGLPRSWRDGAVGQFDAGGQAPDIHDPRLSWHVGDVEDTLPEVGAVAGPKFLVFDLDIYEPSRFAWDYLANSLSPGDLVYFDEAYDADERRLLVEDILPAYEFELIGVTTFGLAARFEGRRVVAGLPEISEANLTEG